MSYTELSNNFAIGEEVFYPSTGLCTVIEEEERNGINYLKLTSQSTDSIILLPVKNAINLGLRHLVTKDDIISSLNILKEKVQDEEKEWKHRVEKNTTLLKSGTPSSICRVLSSLYQRSRIKELPNVERKLFERALDMLVDEASSVLKKSREEIRRLIFSYLENGNEL